jgi:hypothetical protein
VLSNRYQRFEGTCYILVHIFLTRELHIPEGSNLYIQYLFLSISENVFVASLCNVTWMET